MDEDGALIDSGFDDGQPFRVTPEAGGVSLESALRDYGPAAIDDLIPRLRAIARQLDAAHAAGHVHGALHPSKVIVHDDATSVIKGNAPISPYAAPEIADGTATPAADQYGLAAIAYEWMFGRPIDHPADRPVEVRSMPGVDRVTLSKAFTRALARDPGDRFASCTEFCNAVNHALVPELPLLALDAHYDDDPVGPFIPESVESRPNVDDIRIVEPFDSTRADAEHADALLAQDRPSDSEREDLDTITPLRAEPVPVAVASWNPGASSNASRAIEPQRFGAMALFLAVLVGAVFGFAAGYMARPRALQSAPSQEIATVQSTEAPRASGASGGNAPVTKPQAPLSPKAPQALQAPKAPSSVGRLLVRSTPSGSSVSVDGVAKGVTPLALRDLEPGTFDVVIARRGYIPETRRVVISKARPARTLDVRLSSAAVPATPSSAAARSGTAAATGSLNIDSRPTGAAVTLNGKPGGNTPVTITDLPPGEYRIVMTMQGFRNFATTVRVVAGERVRAAASLTAQEQE